jgi:hypothetical protein
VEQGPVSAPFVLMTRFAMLAGASGTSIQAMETRMRIRGEGGRKGASPEKISILISAYGSTAGSGFLHRIGCLFPACSAQSARIGISTKH